MGFISTAAFFVFFAATARTRVVSARFLFFVNDLGTLEVLDDLHNLFFGENSLPCFQRIQIIRICFEHIEEKLFEVDVKIDLCIFGDCFQFHWVV